VKERTEEEAGEECDVEVVQGGNDGVTNDGAETESDNEETQDDDTSTYGDSDSEQFRVSPHEDPHDHDGDEETERARRRRRSRVGRAGERSERAEGTEAGGERGPREGGERGNEGAEGGNASPPNSPTANAAQGGDGERELTGGEGRGFVGSGWWFLALLLMVQLYQSGIVHSLPFLPFPSLLSPSLMIFVGGFLFLCMLALYVGFNSSAMLTYRSRVLLSLFLILLLIAFQSWKYRLAFLAAATIILLGTVS
jgi:hypothetical protein